MGKMKMGILSAFKGKIGTVVGQRWRGAVMFQRAYTDDVRQPNTEAQQVRKGIFRAMVQLSKGFYPAHVIGMREISIRKPTMTTDNEFFRVNKSKITASGIESVSVDFTGLIVAEGPVPSVHFNTPQFDTPLQVDVDFDDNMEVARTHEDDEVFVWVYCPDAKGGVLSEAAKRTDGSVSVKVPSYWNGMKVHVYGFVRSCGKPLAGGYRAFNPYQCSESTYLGTGNIG